MTKMTVCERILSRAAGLDEARPGDVITARPDVVMSHDNTLLIHRAFKEMGGERISDPSSVAVILDHRAPACTVNAANNQMAVRKIVAELGIPQFYDVGTGICHQLLVEKSIAKAGTLVVGSDSHTPTCGAVGAVGVGLGATDMAAVWAKGSVWLGVPESIRVEVGGKAQKGVFAKDVSLDMVARLGAMGADYCCIEFHGGYIANSSTSERMTLCNMAAEAGAKSAIVPQAAPDEGAVYSRRIQIDADKLEPLVSQPHSVDKAVPVRSAEGVRIDQAFIGSCTNGRQDDLEIAAEILGGRKVHQGTRLIVSPASSEVLSKALEKGVIGKLVSAGAVITNPGCGPCLGAHQGVLADGEVCISSGNRNFRGRMGSREASIFLASPATVAASAVEGRIADPRRYLR
jgi:3-isopropylmalate/(R)-2-methylmalate dehydratase large subunit